jgi:hypothetical protein
LICVESPFAVSEPTPPGFSVVDGNAGVDPQIYLRLCALVNAVQREAPGADAILNLSSGQSEPAPVPGCIDVERLSRIAKTNMFLVQQIDDPDRNGRPHAIFAFASRFNHSCSANAFRFFIGNTLFVRVIRRVPPGEEVAIGYVWPDQPLDVRAAASAAFGFVCDCETCREQRSDPEYPLRQEFFVKRQLLPPEQATRAMREALPWLRASCEGRKFTQQFERILVEAARKAADIGDNASALEFLLEATQRLDEQPTGMNRVDVWLNLARMAVATGPSELPQKALEAAVHLTKVLFGFPRSLWPWAFRLDSNPADGRLRSLLREVPD